MIKIAVCDDDSLQLELHCKMIYEFIEKNKTTEFSLEKFQSPYELINCLEKNGSFDLYVLDIMMPHMTGIQLGKKIREKDEEAIIIFLTISPEYAIKSYKLYAFQYLLKPVNKSELSSVIEKAISKIIPTNQRSLLVKTKSGSVPVPFRKIVFIEYSRHCLLYHLNDDSVLSSLVTREPFSKLAVTQFTDKRFVKTHSSFVANMNYIKSIKGTKLIMTNNSSIPITRKYFSQVKKQYADYIMGDDK